MTQAAEYKGRMPGDPCETELVKRFVRVNHAGEYGAVRIYEGQLAVLGQEPVGAVIREMAEQERAHLSAFEKIVPQRQARPTALQPVWHMAGYALGAATALLGARAAMACTVAVEEVIDDHYRKQVERLSDDESELRAKFEQYRKEELEHRDTALGHGAEETPAYGPLTRVVKAGSRLAIWLSERV